MMIATSVCNDVFGRPKRARATSARSGALLSAWPPRLRVLW